MSSRHLTPDQYYNFVAAVAILNRCRIVDIDYAEKVIDIQGPRDAVRACCAELEALLGK